MTGPTRRDLEKQINDLQDEADEREEWSDAEAWRAFLTGQNPRTGEPISDELKAEYRRAWAEFAGSDSDSEEDPDHG